VIFLKKSAAIFSGTSDRGEARVTMEDTDDDKSKKKLE
jgi:hypothetical protein